MDDPDSAGVYVAIYNGQEEPTVIDTGLVGFIDHDGDVIIPFEDSITAEEVARILTATINRERL